MIANFGEEGPARKIAASRVRPYLNTKSPNPEWRIQRVYFASPKCGQNGQYTMSARPMIFLSGTVPQPRLS